jgi:hypothetical protein
MKSWYNYPVIYEINTWVWLQELSQNYKDHITLASVPVEVWDSIADLGIDAVWLMGAWERSPMGIAIANKNKGILEDFRRALSDFQTEDNVGSPYCVRQYVVDKYLGGNEGLNIARKELSRRGIKLILDFIPNHVAPDHPWVIQHPEFFIQGNTDEFLSDPASFIETEGKVFACGRDPYFPAWPDVLQLNAFHPGLRQAAINTLSAIAGQCDGVRCDMAMLFINSVFEHTWIYRTGERPATEYWIDLILAVKSKYPDFIFIAEAYWDMELELQQQGFNYCYDKRLYDYMEKDTAESVHLHLCADISYQGKLVRFIENHDEPRASAVFSPEKERAAAVIMATIPGAKLFHEGQFEGRKVKLPVFLSRRPPEPADPDLQDFYHTLLKTATSEGLRNGHWQLAERKGWPDNPSYRNLLAWCWHNTGEYHLIVVNFSDSGAQGLVRLPWDELKGRTWQMKDLFTEREYERRGDEMCNQGLYVDLPPWGYHFITQLKEKL